MNKQFNGIWIGRRDAMEWPAHSSDSASLDFFLRSYLKSKVYKAPPAHIPEVKAKIPLGFQGRLYWTQL